MEQKYSDLTSKPFEVLEARYNDGVGKKSRVETDLAIALTEDFLEVELSHTDKVLTFDTKIRRAKIFDAGVLCLEAKRQKKPPQEVLGISIKEMEDLGVQEE